MEQYLLEKSLIQDQGNVLMINSTPIQRKTNIKYLGITLNQRLTNHQLLSELKKTFATKYYIKFT